MKRRNFIANAAVFNLDEAMQEILYGRFVSKLFNALKKITRMRRIEIRKSEVKEVFA